MHNNYYFLKNLTSDLASFLPGFVFTDCFSQTKEELILQFSKGQEKFAIKAHLRADFSCLYFPAEISRARKNSVDLFQEAIGRRIVAVEQFQNERSFLVELEQNFGLLFKMHGNRSNILLLHEGNPLALFKNKLVKDWNLRPRELHRELNINKESFLAAKGNFKKVFPTFGKLVQAYLLEQGYEDLSPDQQWDLLLDTHKKLDQAQKYHLTLADGQPALSLLPFGNLLESFDSPLLAINRFFIAYTKEYTLQLEKQAAMQQLNKIIKSSQNYLKKTSTKLFELQSSAKNREVADIIMANLHAIPAGATEAELFDFYNNRPISIKLKKELSPQKNAENFYRKAKNQQLEEQYLKDNIRNKEEKILELELHQEQIEQAESLKDLRAYLKKPELSDRLTETDEKLPYKEFEYAGFQIWVGKGATQNDAMLRYYAHKDDLWFHAKDVSGSHLLLKFKPGKAFPADVKEKAASIAAWYSKRKSDSLCPVICTPKKWVRKRKGAAPGAVVVDKEEEVLLVRPSPFNKAI